MIDRTLERFWFGLPLVLLGLLALFSCPADAQQIDYQKQLKNYPSVITLPPLTGGGTLNSSITIGIGTVTPGQGGTGQTTYTDGQLLIGDSTTNGLDKATITAGNNITVTSGHGSITIASSGGSFVPPNPRTTVYLNENFCGNNNSNSNNQNSYGELGWTCNGNVVGCFFPQTNAGVGDQPAAGNWPCVIEVDSQGTTNGEWTVLTLGSKNSAGPRYLTPTATTATVHMSMKPKKSGVDNTGIVRAGFIDNNGTQNPANEVLFELPDNNNVSTDWFAKTCSASTCTSVDTGITADTVTWRDYEIDFNASSTVVFKINGAVVATINTNVPTVSLQAAFEALCSTHCVSLSAEPIEWVTYFQVVATVSR